MKISKTLIFIFAITMVTITFAQDTNKVEKIKIGKFKYELYLKSSFNYELNFYVLSYYLKKGCNEQYIGSALSYRNDVILSKGNVFIDYNYGSIICKSINLSKQVLHKEDSTYTTMTQNKKGFFKTTLVIEYKDGKENVLFKK
jgi:coenzyme F420-reducing hydrogenase beta subunit